MLMAPVVRRSWSVRGQTPVLRQRGRCHQKVSAIAALCVLPTRDRLALYFRLHPDANITAERAMAFLEHLQRQLRTPIVLIWDRFQAHKGELLEVSEASGGRSFGQAVAMAMRTRRAAYAVQRRQDLLRAFLRHTGLPLRLT